MSIWFDDMPVLGKLTPAQAAAKLREVGESEAASGVMKKRLMQRP